LKEVEFDNGTYMCKESYDINITKDVIEFVNSIGFLQEYKLERIKQYTEGWTPNERSTYTSVKEVSYLGEHEVFDITVDNSSHTYWTGGLSVSNCAEQSLANYETCCLAEVFLPNVESYDEFLQILEFLYRICKHSLRLKCHHAETQDKVHENMRMGIGITGYMQVSRDQKSWLAPAYTHLREFDRKYSESMGWPVSVKLTTVKPSGTLSLLAGVTPGVHPGYSQYYIRRMRIAAGSPLIAKCREAGYPVEWVRRFDGTNDMSTVVVSFPCQYPEGTVLAKEVSAIAQLEAIAELQALWSDNAVSCTVYYRSEELEGIKSWLRNNYNTRIKTVSFLLHSEHGFDQAPLEEITKEEFERLSSSITPIQPISKLSEEEADISTECTTGACPIK